MRSGLPGSRRTDSEGLPVPQSRAMGASAARMAKRSGHAESVGHDARRERPAMGRWQPRACATPGARKANCPHDLAAVRAVLERFRRYLLSHFWHYHRLWKLNYRVRDGNGCDLPDMFTGNCCLAVAAAAVMPRRSGDCAVVVVIGCSIAGRRLMQASTRYEWSSIRPLVPVG